MLRRFFLLLFLLIPILISCATRIPRREALPDKAGDPKIYQIVVPFFPQGKNQCGPASLASILKFYQIDTNPDEISKEIYLSSVKGTLNIDLLFYARSRGLVAEAYHGDMEDLKRQIAESRPLLLFLNLGLKIFPAGHYVVVTGFNDRDNIVYAHSGGERDKPIRYSDFMRAWEEGDFWTLLIRPRI